MTYLISQIFLSLVVAFILGVLFGFLLSRIFGGKKQVVYQTDENNYDEENHDGYGQATATTSSAATAAVASSTASAQDFVSSYDDDAEDMATINLDTDVNLDADEYLIETLEGIGPQTGNLFREYGIHTVGDFLRKLHRPASREQAAKDLNILAKPLHDWASMADLLRVEGLDHQMAELAHASGITTVGELASANAVELAAEMDTVNNAGKQLIAPTVPSAEELQSWIDKAKTMSPVITVF
jgi:predicted flap endonuclease-1-like 5' DNA nuclease